MRLLPIIGTSLGCSAVIAASLSRYGSVKVTTSSPGHLLVQLYDAMFRFLRGAAAALEAWSGGDVEMFEGLVCLQQSQKLKCAVQDAHVLVGGDHNDGVACKSRAANNVAFRTNAIQTEMHPRDEGR